MTDQRIVGHGKRATPVPLSGGYLYTRLKPPDPNPILLHSSDQRSVFQPQSPLLCSGNYQALSARCQSFLEGYASLKVKWSTREPGSDAVPGTLICDCRLSTEAILPSSQPPRVITCFLQLYASSFLHQEQGVLDELQVNQGLHLTFQ